MECYVAILRANIIDRSIASLLKVANHAGFLPEVEWVVISVVGF